MQIAKICSIDANSYGLCFVCSSLVYSDFISVAWCILSDTNADSISSEEVVLHTYRLIILLVWCVPFGRKVCALAQLR